MLVCSAPLAQSTFILCTVQYNRDFCYQVYFLPPTGESVSHDGYTAKLNNYLAISYKAGDFDNNDGYKESKVTRWNSEVATTFQHNNNSTGKNDLRHYCTTLAI